MLTAELNHHHWHLKNHCPTSTHTETKQYFIYFWTLQDPFQIIQLNILLPFVMCFKIKKCLKKKKNLSLERKICILQKKFQDTWMKIQKHLRCHCFIFHYSAFSIILYARYYFILENKCRNLSSILPFLWNRSFVFPTYL